jgi:hypothetical protein
MLMPKRKIKKSSKFFSFLIQHAYSLLVMNCWFPALSIYGYIIFLFIMGKMGDHFSKNGGQS